MKSMFWVSLAVLMGCQPAADKATNGISGAPSSVFDASGKEAQIVVTADSGGLRLAPMPSLTFRAMQQPLETQPCIFIDPAANFQSFMGIGAALTDASAETFFKLSKEKQQTFLKAHFDSVDGIGYTVARTNINSCDFSSESYTYVAPNDTSLASFSLAPDKRFKLPFIKEALAASGGRMLLYGSPWSPPAWMKTNNNMLYGGKLKPEYVDAWSRYYTKFIKAYEAEGVPVWGISIQNEPMATQIWESCIYTAEEERDFLKNHLGPAMHAAGLAEKKIIMWDHNRDLLYQRATTYLSDPVVRKYAWGIGFHWYEDWSGGDQLFDNVRRVHEAYPDVPLMFTEGCNGPFKYDGLQSWALGERYGRSMIHDFNNGMTAFTDWNILLDENGGPNHVKNFCFAPVHADTRSGELIFTNAYYYIGHFSKYIKPGAKRIGASSSRSALLTTAFRNPDGKLVVIVMNPANTSMKYHIWINGQAAEATAFAHSISTILL